MAFNMDRFGQMAGAGGLGAGLLSYFMGGDDNPADAGMEYLNKIPGEVGKYYEPYINAGQKALGPLQNEYSNLMKNPGGRLNEIGGSYQQSPGFKFALQQALQGAGHAAAAGGMAGSPQHEFQNMDIATQLGNQDYYKWLEQATGLYGKGMSGMSDIAGMGYKGSSNLADQIAQALAAKSQLAYQGQAAQNQSQGSMLGNLVGSAATLAAFL